MAHSLCRCIPVLIQKVSSRLPVSLACCLSVKYLYKMEIEIGVGDIRKRQHVGNMMLLSKDTPLV